MRIRVHFSKTDAMRFCGHLDVQRAWERTLRRAGLPLAYSQGFNPRPRLNLASALPLGFTSQAEVLDITLEHELPLEEIARALQKALPPGLALIHLTPLDPKAPALQSQLRSAEYTVTLLQPCADLDLRLQTLLDSAEIPRQRRGKSYDLRPLIQALERIPDDEHGRQRLRIILSAQEGATGRPEEVLLAMKLQPAQARFHRTRLLFTGDYSPATK